MQNVINMEVIDELVSLSEDGDPELLVDLIRMFLEDAPQKLAAIESAFAGGDLEQVERAAHSLKGSSGNLGAILVQQHCETIQNASRKHERAAIATAVPQLVRDYAAAEAALRTLLGKYR